MRVQGYALAWDIVADTNIGAVKIARGALRPSPAGVSLVCYDHSSSSVADVQSGTLTVAQDEYGLRFEADLPDCYANSINRNCCGVSPQWEPVREHLDAYGVFVVDEANLVHICAPICAPAWGHATGIWPADQRLEAAPPHIRNLARRYEQHFAARLGRQGPPPARQLSKPPPSIAPSVFGPGTLMGLPSYFQSIITGSAPRFSRSTPPHIRRHVLAAFERRR